MKFAIAIPLVALANFRFIQAADNSDRLRLKIIMHQPCSSPGSRPSERIRFSSLDHAPLKPDTKRGGGCYSILGPVFVSQAIRGSVDVYSEVRFSPKSPPEPCRGADKYNCGGYGSCCYCNVCQNSKNVAQLTSDLVHLESTNGRSLNCQSSLNPGTYNNIRISFCLPTKDQFLKSPASDALDSYNNNGNMFFVTLYIFNEQVHTYSTSKLRGMASPANSHVIGCHKIVGRVYEAS